MRRLAFVALVVAAACGESTKLPPGPSDTFYKPIGLGVYGGKLLVASSNADLRFDDPTGGSVITVDPSADPAPLTGTLNIRSFAGQVAVADPLVCPIANAESGALAIVPVRGDDVVYRIRTTADGALVCNGCETALSSAGWADAFTAGLACGPGIARAYVGYLRSSFGQAVFSQLDLTKSPGDPAFLQTAAVGFGVVQGYAYDAPRERLYFTRTAIGAAGTLAFVDLADDCNFDPARGGVACPTGQANAPNGIELRGIVLSTSEAAPRRAYMTARIFDSAAAASSGVRIGDFDGLLIVADLVENLAGRLELQIVNQLPIGYGAAEIVRLPARPGKRDVVAALAADDAVLWIYDDETGEAVQIGRDLVGAAPTGAPFVGHIPFGLAADPVARAGVGRVYVASYEESLVTPIDVPLDDIRGACPVPKIAGGCPATPADVRRIAGGAR